MFGDIVLAIRNLIKKLYHSDKKIIRQRFCIHDYETRMRVLGNQSLTQKTCKKCGREKFCR